MQKEKNSKVGKHDRGKTPAKSLLTQAEEITFKEIVDLTKTIIEEGYKLKRPPISETELERGFQVSYDACKQQTKVPMTPIMRNILMEKDQKDELSVDDPQSKAEKYVIDESIKLLTKMYGPKRDEYNRELGVMDPDHYGVDCWRNLKDNFRDIQPGQEEQRRETIARFRTKPDLNSLKWMFDDKTFQKAVLVVFERMPRVKARTDFRKVNLPFQTKHTNVGFKWWQNDQNVDPDTGKTYADLTMDIAMATSIAQYWMWNVSTAFGRNQRGKGRLLIAPSRVLNLGINRLEAAEIEALKLPAGYFTGYLDDEGLKHALVYIGEFAEANGLTCENFDQAGFDWHISPWFIALIGAMRALRCRDALGRRLSIARAIFGIKTFLVDGLSREVIEIFGRMFSGEEDTNEGDGWIETVCGTATHMMNDPHYLSKVEYKSKHPMLVMGDDWLTLYDPAVETRRKIVDTMARFNFEVHHDKGEYGTFFLQYRLIKKDGKYLMMYPWTRVLRSMLFKERDVQLGEYGWLLSQYQQLYKLVENPQALDAVVSIIYKYDRLKLGVHLSVPQIKAGVKQEDAEAVKEKGRKAKSTATKLYDGDPSKAKQFDEKGEISSAFIVLVHNAIKASVRRIETAKSRLK